MSADAIAAVRVAGLDRSHKVAPFYRRIETLTDAESLKDELTARIAEFNEADAPPQRRAALILEIRDLRGRLRAGGAL